MCCLKLRMIRRTEDLTRDVMRKTLLLALLIPWLFGPVTSFCLQQFLQRRVLPQWWHVPSNVALATALAVAFATALAAALAWRAFAFALGQGLDRTGQVVHLLLQGPSRCTDDDPEVRDATMSPDAWQCIRCHN